MRLSLSYLVLMTGLITLPAHAEAPWATFGGGKLLATGRLRG
jgi:hypothetical protein